MRRYAVSRRRRAELKRDAAAWIGQAIREGVELELERKGRAIMERLEGTGRPLPLPLVDERAWPALVRPGMYAGERRPGETQRAYLERAVAAYRSPGPGVKL